MVSMVTRVTEHLGETHSPAWGCQTIPEREKELIENKLKSILAAKKKEIERKFAKKEGEDERTLKLKKKAALYSFAQQRGFTFDMIQKIEKEL